MTGSVKTMTDGPKVLIIIVDYDSADATLRCLKTLNKLDYKNFEVVVVENAGKPAYDRLIRMLMGEAVAVEELLLSGFYAAVRGEMVCSALVTVINAEKNLGYAGGVNLALRHFLDDAEWKRVWILNPDTRVDQSSLGYLVEQGKRDGWGIIGSRLVFSSIQKVQMYGGKWRKFIGRGFNLGMMRDYLAIVDEASVERTQDYVSGSCMFVSREFIESVGLMDERFFLYCEEVDWCLRRGALDLLYCHSSIVYHDHGATLGSATRHRDRSALSVYLDERNKLLLTKIHYPGIYNLVVLTTLALTLQYAILGAWPNFRAALSGWTAGLKGEVGAPGNSRLMSLSRRFSLW